MFQDILDSIHGLWYILSILVSIHESYINIYIYIYISIQVNLKPFAFMLDLFQRF